MFSSAAVLLLVALLFGGAANIGAAGDLVVQLVAIPCLLLAVRRVMADGTMASAPVILTACFLSVPLLQLIPLPSVIWTRLPGSALLTDAYAALGASPGWRPLSVAPTLTWLSFVSMLPPAAMFLAVVHLDYAARRKLGLIMLFAGIALAFVGLLQVLGGNNSPLYTFADAGRGDAVGFFANRNHFAALMYSSLLMASAWSVLLRDKKWSSRIAAQDGRVVLAVGVAGSMLVFFAAIMMARSRSGLILGSAAAVAGVMLVANQYAKDQAARLAMAAGVLVAIVIGLQFALPRVLARFGTDPMDDARWTIAATTWHAVRAYFPTGAGFGTFVPVYAHFERPQDILPDRYVNHAHNEWLQLLLETGLLGWLVIAAAVIVLCNRAGHVWSRPDRSASPLDVAMAKAAGMILVFVSLHSLVEFPMRTAAIAVTLALCAGLLFAPPPTRDTESHATASGQKTSTAGDAATTLPQRSAAQAPQHSGYARSDADRADASPARNPSDIVWPTAPPPAAKPAAAPDDSAKASQAEAGEASQAGPSEDDWPEEWRRKP
jgi:O-antigen ligase